MHLSATRSGVKLLVQVVGICLLQQASSAQAENYPIAGTVPDQRPANAPVITSVQKGDQWYVQALTGVEPPYPASLRFLEDQGNWYTPFTHPGMPGPYDLRQWYR